MTALVSFFIFAVLLAIARRGSSLQCQTCYSLNGNCTGPIRECNPEFDACGSLVVETKTSAKTEKTIKKVCTTRSKCIPGVIFMDLENEYQESGNSICCTTDGCNTATLTVPTRNRTLNGLRCPFCYAKRPDTCQEEAINCRGSETQCFTRGAGGHTITTINSVTTVTYEITQKGCATESFCANAAETGIVVSGKSVIFGSQEIQCRAASHEANPRSTGGQNTAVGGGTSTTADSTRLYLHLFAGILMTKSFYRCLF
ncbi:phospholipase A2 inhibitor and Ly6/PLAUR domain-containing protein-like [Eublepharis macularius]|uniref:Phospholipase A2 inhibitor and Ly6/PLAUR domain-containing protein-like n=1 Tax=Eublepharis macularius TaxID=481883 RepID=A0AA97KF09_EUBMA|nr:phospholipase A2 inhibitor and Ly6/PLAUR domain-containing protein-like [Eublepharis macularius]